MLACWSDRIVQNSCSGLASFRKQVDLRYLSPKLQCWKCLLAFCLTWEENTDFSLRCYSPGSSFVHHDMPRIAPVLMDLSGVAYKWAKLGFNFIESQYWLWCMMNRQICICVLGDINLHTRKDADSDFYQIQKTSEQ